MNRRHAMAILGAVAFTSCSRRDPLLTFSAIAFGTEVHFQTHGISAPAFDQISTEVSNRLREIESLFSLYDSNSAIRRLNRDGKLDNPPPEFLKLVRIALDSGEKTGGLFDITVQPLWDWRQAWKAADNAGRTAMQADSWNTTVALVDYRKVSAYAERISLEKAGMAITLNGIAQGYATDEVVALLKKHGIRNALVNIGEYAALGTAPDGKPWSVKIAATGETLALPSGRALAVSAGSGHIFDPDGRFHHLFRPSDGANIRPRSTIIVTAPTATVADALSTALSVANDAQRREILANFSATDYREIHGD